MKKKIQQSTITPEWPHKVEAKRIGKEPVSVKLTATEQQCKDMARRGGVSSIESLAADMTLQRASANNLIHVKGQINAMVTQSCAVTLKPVQSKITDDFEAWFTDHEQVVSLAGVRRERDSMLSGGELPVADEIEDPEQAIDGFVDVGELAAQYFCLALDPYPLAEGASYEKSIETGSSARPGKQLNPFAALKDWKAGRSDE